MVMVTLLINLINKVDYKQHKKYRFLKNEWKINDMFFTNESKGIKKNIKNTGIQIDIFKFLKKL